MPQVPGVTTYLHGALIGMEVRINTSAWPGYTEAITANENALIDLSFLDLGSRLGVSVGAVSLK